MNHCITTPFPSNGTDNFTNAPLFANLAGGDFRLQFNSPCINAGDNAFALSSTDMDGNPRISGGTVDIGAYEFQSPASAISYAYLMQYGLPIDGSADFTDPDGDGMSNWQEWRAGTNPTNSSSLLRMFMPTNNSSGIKVSWQSVSNRTYFLQRSANVSALTDFSTIQGNVLGQTGTTSYTDTSATNSGSYFYRVGVQ